jgi:RNA polymerase sigma factor (sigma-70 family)
MGVTSGADKSFEAFFDATWPRCRRLAARMGLDPGGAEDVALEALAIAYDRWKRVNSLEHREAWLFKVTANLALRQLKKCDRAGNRSRAPAVTESQAGARVDIYRALSRLSRRQREVVYLRYIADLPEAEVAAALGVDVGTVKVHASRGRSALAEILNQEYGRGIDEY